MYLKIFLITDFQHQTCANMLEWAVRNNRSSSWSNNTATKATNIRTTPPDLAELTK